MKKIISIFALFMAVSATAMTNTCDQLNSAHTACDRSAVSGARFAGLGGLFGNQDESKVPVKYRHRASSSRFVGLGGLFGNQDESVVAINFQQENIAMSARFSGLGGLFSGQRAPEISPNPVLASVL